MSTDCTTKSRAEKAREWRKKNPGKAYEAAKRWREKHPERARASHQKYVKANPEKRKYWDRTRQLKRDYGLSRADFDALHTKQNGLCAICKIPLKDTKTTVDHSHATGKVRGLLCYRCNLGLGYLELQGFLPAALEYLKGL